MDLAITFPPDWLTQRRGSHVIAAVPGYAFVPDLTVDVHPIVPRLEIDLPRLLGGAPETESTGRTVTGWPTTIVERPGRLVFQVAILIYSGVVVARGDATRLASRRAEILEVLATARPHLRSASPARIGELWDLT